MPRVTARRSLSKASSRRFVGAEAIYRKREGV
jgi:hypothetical protein